MILATRGSALALAQAREVAAVCRHFHPTREVDLRVIKTSGDKLQTAPLENPHQTLGKGLFTREIEEALLRNEADLAVHSLKDLPTELPAGLKLGAVLPRADVRDVLLYRHAAELRKDERQETSLNWVPGQPTRRGYLAQLQIDGLSMGACIGSNSSRRAAQAQAIRPDLKFVGLRGNVPTRLRKLSEDGALDALILALAGLSRLGMSIDPKGQLLLAPGNSWAEPLPNGLMGTTLSLDQMIPCPGQGAIGIEIREGDEKAEELCQAINDTSTFAAVRAERALLRGLGGGCEVPLGAHAALEGGFLRLRAVMESQGKLVRVESTGPPDEPEKLGLELAERLKKAAG